MLRILAVLCVILGLSLSSAQAAPKDAGIPDGYSCAPDRCNKCNFKTIGVGSLVKSIEDGGCTEVGCAGSPEITALYNQCSKDWRYSKSIRFDEFSAAENSCVNALRNHVYWEDTYPRKAYDRHYAFAQCIEDNGGHKASPQCQNGWKDYMPTDQGIVLKHAQDSKDDAYQLCNGYFDGLEEQFGFSKNEMNVLARYMLSRQFPAFETHQSETMVRGQKMKDVEILKQIFTTLQDSKLVNLRMPVTPATVDGFMQAYREKIAP